MIATHNFMHLFTYPKENEFDFVIDRTFSMLNLLWTEPENSLRVLLSFFGHYGVGVFILLSSYGLSKKYTNQTLYFRSFIIDRFAKLFPAFIIAILMWATLQGVYSYGILGPFKVLAMNYQELLLKLTLLSNFMTDKALAPVGPWWFIPFIFQFYFSFPLFLKIYDRWKETGLLVLSAFCLTLSASLGGMLFDVNLYYTILPYVPVFSLGVYLAKKETSVDSIHTPKPFILATAMIFILGNFNEQLWVLSNLCFTILFLALMSFAIPKIKNNTKNFLLFTGKISMGLFLVNGFLRFPIIHWAMEKDHWLLTIGLCLLSLGASYIAAITLHTIEKYLTQSARNYFQEKKGVSSFRPSFDLTK